MQPEYESLEDIRREFDIAETDSAKVLDILRGIRASLHPDRDGGNFKDEAIEKQFHRTSAAIDFVKPLAKSRALELVANGNNFDIFIRDSIKAQVPAIIQEQQLQSTQKIKIKEKTDELLKRYRRKTNPPQSILSIASAVLTFVWFLPESVAENALFGEILAHNSTLFFVLWSQALAATTFYWAYTWWRLEAMRKFYEHLDTEYVQDVLFEDFLRRHEAQISPAEFIRYLVEGQFLEERHLRDNVLQMRLLKGHSNIDLPTAQLISDAVFQRALKTGAIRTGELNGLFQTYILCHA